MLTKQGMTNRQADEYRRNGVAVNGCYACLNLNRVKAQWLETDLKFVGAKALCHEHYKQATEIKDLEV